MLHTPLCDLLTLAHPIISAPMGGAATAELAAAVSAAGGLGMIGGSGPSPAWLRTQIRAVRERTDRPFGVGFISSAPGVEELVRIAIEERVAAISHSFADPTPYVAPAHAAGIKVLAQVQTVAQARVAAQAGVDVIAAQGTDAGGHTGAIGTLSLLPAVLDAVAPLPVVAAGGIGDGRGLAAMLLLGAVGAWIGTRFVASEEARGAAWLKQRVVAATADETVLTRVYDLATAAPFPAEIGQRVLVNAFTQAWHGREDEVVTRRAELRGAIERASAVGDTGVAPVSAGGAAGVIAAVEPAGEIVRRIVAEAERVLRERPQQVLR
jgi:nitronate monooxygenase